MRLAATLPLAAPPELRALAEQVFTAVSAARFVTVGSLMAFAGRDGLAGEMIDAWCDAGLFHRGHVRLDPLAVTETSYVALTPAGARALATSTGHRVEGITAARLKRSSQKRSHDVAVGEVALAVLSLAKDRRIELVAVETDDRKLATSVLVEVPGEPAEHVVLQPDALVLTRSAVGLEALLVEVDRGTIAPGRMARRYAAFLGWQREGGPLREYETKALRVLTLVPNEARLRKLHAAALEANAGKRSAFLIFGLQDDATTCDAERMLERIGRPLGGGSEERVRILSPRTVSVAA